MSPIFVKYIGVPAPRGEGIQGVDDAVSDVSLHAQTHTQSPGAIDRHQLPGNADVLPRRVLDLIAQGDAEQARRIKTEHLLQQLLQAQSGRRSEPLSPDQLALFAAELKAQGVNHAPTSPSGNTEAGPPRDRRPMPPHWKRERIVHELAEGEKYCTGGAQDLRPIGEESSERYEFIPAQVIVIEDICKKYACACTVKTATQPSQAIEKSNAGAGLLTQGIVAKYADPLPLHRQAKMFRRWAWILPTRRCAAGCGHRRICSILGMRG